MGGCNTQYPPTRLREEEEEGICSMRPKGEEGEEGEQA